MLTSKASVILKGTQEFHQLEGIHTAVLKVTLVYLARTNTSDENNMVTDNLLSHRGLALGILTRLV